MNGKKRGERKMGWVSESIWSWPRVCTSTSILLQPCRLDWRPELRQLACILRACWRNPSCMHDLAGVLTILNVGINCWNGILSKTKLGRIRKYLKPTRSPRVFPPSSVCISRASGQMIWLIPEKRRENGKKEIRTSWWDEIRPNYAQELQKLTQVRQAGRHLIRLSTM